MKFKFLFAFLFFLVKFHLHKIIDLTTAIQLVGIIILAHLSYQTNLGFIQNINGEETI